MPPLPAVPGVIKVEWLWTQDGVPAANITHIGYTGSPPAPRNLEDLCGPPVVAWWSAAAYMKADYPSTTVLVGVRATDLSSSSGSVADIAIGEAGTASDGPLPANASMMVDLTIARRYRGGHPRIYFPPPALGDLATPSTWSTTQIADLTGAMESYFSTASGPTSGSTTLLYPVNVSYRSANAPRITPVVDQLTGFVVSGLVRSQRRRVTASSY